ncbi:MAG: class I SAM-dependent methyltransferase [Vicinamibacterales bacterium]
MTAARAPRTDHYSYRVYADPAMAEAFDGLRFSGPIGQLIARTQEQIISGFLDPIEGRTVLDVGTGTGRAAIALSRRGARVTGVDASAEMLAVAGRRSRDAGVDVRFLPGDAHGLAFESRSFDAVICLRVLMHTPEWRTSLAELCRVARDRVVFDYPAFWSAAALQAAFRRAAQTFGSGVEAYRVFRGSAIAAALASHGFRITGEHRQFVLPIAVHKRLNSEAATGRIERAFSRAGLTRVFGSPVTVLAERCAS